MTLKEKLNKIQVELKAPKNLYNKYGNYKYRNAEGILEGVKPLLAETKTILLLQDEIVTFGDSSNTYKKYEEDKGSKAQIEAIGQRFYVKATATLKDCESDEEISISAYARESLDKKGQDQSQITGSTSSYARKYALNGLFILDDTKDEDASELKEEKDNKAAAQTKSAPAKPTTAPAKPPTTVQNKENLIVMIKEVQKQINLTPEIRQKHLDYYKVKDESELSEENALKYLKQLEQARDKNLKSAA